MASTGDTWRVGYPASSKAASRVRSLTRADPARLLVLGGMILFVVRGVSRWRDPRMFAEDGTNFLADARNHGLDALVTPYAGYLHAIPRLIAAALEPVTLTAVPTVYVLTAMAGYLIMIAPVLSPRMGLLPTPVARAAAFVGLGMLPALWECYGNVANLIFAGGITLFLLLMSSDPATRTGRVTELVAVGLLGLSGPFSVIFTPFFTYRCRRNRSRHSRIVFAVLTASAVIQVAVYVQSSRETPGGGTLGLLIRTMIDRVGGGWVFGNEASQIPAGVVVAVGALWLAGALIATLSGLRTAALIAWALIGVLIASAVWAYGPTMLTFGPAYALRHLLIPQAILVVLLVSVIASERRRSVRFVAVCCLLAGVGGVAANWAPFMYPRGADMAALQRCVDSVAPSCSVPNYQDGWRITLVR